MSNRQYTCIHFLVQFLPFAYICQPFLENFHSLLATRLSSGSRPFNNPSKQYKLNRIHSLASSINCELVPLGIGFYTFILFVSLFRELLTPETMGMIWWKREKLYTRIFRSNSHELPPTYHNLNCQIPLLRSKFASLRPVVSLHFSSTSAG